MEADSNLLKLKNKKKDIIISEKETMPIKEENKIKEINTSIETSQTNTKLIENIIYNFQLFLSLTDKIDLKLADLIIPFLSTEHIKVILEERDCKIICGNYVCGNKLLYYNNSNKNKKYFFNSNSKSFTKDDLLVYFCDVKCFQKFKDYYKKAEKYDYFTYLKLENICRLSILSKYYPGNKYLDEISKDSNTLILKASAKHDPQVITDIINNYIKNFEKFFSHTDNDIHMKDVVICDDLGIDKMLNDITITNDNLI